MPRFYFDVASEGSSFFDRQGTALADLGAAHHFARATAFECLRHAQSTRVDVTIRDEHGPRVAVSLSYSELQLVTDPDLPEKITV